MTAWLADDVRRIIEEACSSVADIDIMGHWGGRRVPRGSERE
jgi:hypothetical protein